MCGRFAYFAPAEQLERQYGLTGGPAPAARYNICPGQEILAIREPPDSEREGALFHWGLVPGWAKDRSIGNRMINARGETVAQKPAFRKAFRSRRCIIPASGFFEWGPSAAGRWPYFIRLRNAELLSFAGLWERWIGPDGVPLESCAIITMAASRAVASIHERMPVCLPSSAHAVWLDADTPAVACERLLDSPSDVELEIRPVSRAVNNPRNDGPSLVEPVVIAVSSASEGAAG